MAGLVMDHQRRWSKNPGSGTPPDPGQVQQHISPSSRRRRPCDPGEGRQREGVKDERSYRLETYGGFEHRVRLPADIDVEKAAAEYKETQVLVDRSAPQPWRKRYRARATPGRMVGRRVTILRRTAPRINPRRTCLPLRDPVLRGRIAGWGVAGRAHRLLCTFRVACSAGRVWRSEAMRRLM